MYASPETITRSSATLGPNRGPNGWQDLDLLGGYERFPILFPLSQALHGTLSAPRLIRSEPLASGGPLRTGTRGPDEPRHDLLDGIPFGG